MNRREALGVTMKLLGTTIVGSQAFLSGCIPSTSEDTSSAVSSDYVGLLNEIAETILPHSEDSPGAREAAVGDFMRLIVNDCYSDEEQEIFKTGIDMLEKRSKDDFGSQFMKLNEADRLAFLLTLDKEASETREGEPTHYFTMIKQLTIWGYFSSEPGATKALRYNPIPGKYLGCEDYVKGEKAWA